MYSPPGLHPKVWGAKHMKARLLHCRASLIREMIAEYRENYRLRQTESPAGESRRGIFMHKASVQSKVEKNIDLFHEIGYNYLI